MNKPPQIPLLPEKKNEPPLTAIIHCSPLFTGRIILLGDSGSSFGSTGLVAFSASRKAVEGAAEALRGELHSSGVDVVLLKPPPVNPLALYAPPLLKT